METNPFTHEKKRALLSKFIVVIASLLILALIAVAVVLTAPQHLATAVYETKDGFFSYDAATGKTTQATAKNNHGIFELKGNNLYLRTGELIDTNIWRIKYSSDGTAAVYDKYNKTHQHLYKDGKITELTDYTVTDFIKNSRSMLVLKDGELLIRNEQGELKSVAKRVLSAVALDIKGKQAFVYVSEGEQSKQGVVMRAFISIDGAVSLLGRSSRILIDSAQERISVTSPHTNNYRHENNNIEGIYITLDSNIIGIDLPGTLYHISPEGELNLITNNFSQLLYEKLPQGYVLYTSYNAPHNLHLYRDGTDYDLGTQSRQVAIAKDGRYIIYAEDNKLYYKRIGAKQPVEILTQEWDGKPLPRSSAHQTMYPIMEPEAMVDYIFYFDYTGFNPYGKENGVNLCMSTFGGQKRVLAKNCCIYQRAEQRIYFTDITKTGKNEYGQDLYKYSLYSYKPGLLSGRRLIIEFDEVTSRAVVLDVVGDDLLFYYGNEAGNSLYVSRSGGKPKPIGRDFERLVSAE